MEQLADRTSGPARIKQTVSLVVMNLLRLWSLFFQLTKREVENKYRGAGLGMVWTILTPLMMLGVYTFVFGTVFTSKWAVGDAPSSPFQFAVILFSGLIVFQVFADVVTRAPVLILQNSMLVKRVVFPLGLLVPVVLGAALFHAFVSFLILLPFIWLLMGKLSATIFYAPLIMAALSLMVLGIGWFLASLGTFVRDISQVIGTVTTALMFLSPIFFPLSSLPEWIRPIVAFNPLSIPVEEMRNAVVFGQQPDFIRLGIYAAVACFVAAFGFAWFRATRKAFADVL